MSISDNNNTPRKANTARSLVAGVGIRTTGIGINRKLADDLYDSTSYPSPYYKEIYRDPLYEKLTNKGVKN